MDKHTLCKMANDAKLFWEETSDNSLLIDMLIDYAKDLGRGIDYDKATIEINAIKTVLLYRLNNK